MVGLNYEAIKRIICNAPEVIRPGRTRMDLQAMLYVVDDLCAANNCTLSELIEAVSSSDNTEKFIKAEVWR